MTVQTGQASAQSASGALDSDTPLRSTLVEPANGTPIGAAAGSPAQRRDPTGNDEAADTADPDEPATGTVPATRIEPLNARAASVDTLDATEDKAADTEAGFGRQNDRAAPVDDLKPGPAADPDAVPGFAIGTLVLRPTVSEKIVHETRRDGSGTTGRTFSETTLTGTLESDWSRHRLTVDGVATLQKNLSGTGSEQPRATLDAVLLLDLSRDLQATLKAGYDFSREDRTDPNAVSGAVTQATVEVFSAGAAVEKSIGNLRGTVATEVTRSVYGDVVLADSSVLSGADRDTLAGTVSGRIGYVLSPALIPFLQASVQRTRYDQTLDDNGFARSSTAYAAKIGAEIDLGEKLNGELAAGYVLRDIDDATLTDIGAVTVDGTLNWSPMRGTMLTAGLATSVEAATAAGESGSVVYALTTGLTRELRRSVVARLGSSITYRDYASDSLSPDQVLFGATMGLSWSLNRYLSLDADVGFERTTQPGSPDSDTARVGLGLKLKR
ncbi:outer membrane beta-barrel protein [Hoeflea marina]|uniref:outer membrane beta-barrel protein n=1 Tax=Hoeflea marina TaxID=274592 RepID=UPI001304BEC1|nr:outer membrane beta-barrel protein [Hoeflea marina]